MSETTSAPATPAVEKQTQRQQPKRELTRQQKLRLMAGTTE